MRYVSRPRFNSDDVWYEGPLPQAPSMTVIETEKSECPTHILDVRGNPIFAVDDDAEPIGFVCNKERER